MSIGKGQENSTLQKESRGYNKEDRLGIRIDTALDRTKSCD